jgi:hypothetical protein
MMQSRVHVTSKPSLFSTSARNLIVAGVGVIFILLA